MIKGKIYGYLTFDLSLQTLTIEPRTCDSCDVMVVLHVKVVHFKLSSRHKIDNRLCNVGPMAVCIVSY